MGCGASKEGPHVPESQRPAAANKYVAPPGQQQGYDAQAPATSSSFAPRAPTPAPVLAPPVSLVSSAPVAAWSIADVDRWLVSLGRAFAPYCSDVTGLSINDGAFLLKLAAMPKLLSMSKLMMRFKMHDAEHRELFIEMLAELVQNDKENQAAAQQKQQQQQQHEQPGASSSGANNVNNTNHTNNNSHSSGFSRHLAPAPSPSPPLRSVAPRDVHLQHHETEDDEEEVSVSYARPAPTNKLPTHAAPIVRKPTAGVVPSSRTVVATSAARPSVLAPTPAPAPAVSNYTEDFEEYVEEGAGRREQEGEQQQDDDDDDDVGYAEPVQPGLYAPQDVQRFASLFFGTVPADTTEVRITLDGTSIGPDAVKLGATGFGAAAALASKLPQKIKKVVVELEQDNVDQCPTASKQLLLDVLACLPELHELDATVSAGGGQLDRALSPAAALGKMVSLRRLKLDVPLGPDLIDAVATLLPSLQFLDLNNGSWPAQPLERLVADRDACPKLAELALHNQVMTKDTLTTLAKLPQLRVLRPKLWHPDALQALPTFVPLCRSLAVALEGSNDSKLTPWQGVMEKTLRRFKVLSDLELRYVEIRGEDWTSMVEVLPVLRRLTFHGRCRFPDGLAPLVKAVKAANKKDLQTLSFVGFGQEVRVDDLRPLAELASLYEVNLHVPTAAEQAKTKKLLTPGTRKCILQQLGLANVVVAKRP